MTVRVRILNPVMSGTGFEHSRYPDDVIQSSSLPISSFSSNTHISVGNRAAPEPMNSSDRSNTGRAAATASNLSALWISHQTLRRLSASMGASFQLSSHIRVEGYVLRETYDY